MWMTLLTCVTVVAVILEVVLVFFKLTDQLDWPWAAWSSKAILIPLMVLGILVTLEMLVRWGYAIATALCTILMNAWWRRTKRRNGMED